MKLEDAYVLAEALTEERKGGKNNGFKVELGENEGENIPHFHLDNGETGKNKRKLPL